MDVESNKEASAVSGKHKRRRNRAFHRAPQGAAPGTLSAGEDGTIQLRLLAYGVDTVVERTGGLADLPMLLEAAAGLPVRWIDVVGLGDIAALEAIATLHNLHPLALEDVVHVHQRAKVEHFEDHDFITARMVQPGTTAGEELDLEQVSLFVGAGWLLTFQERHGDVFGAVRERIRSARGRLRSAGADFLTYALLDAIVDAAFPVLESYDNWLDRIERRIIAGAGQGVVAELHRVRADLLVLRRAIWPLREAMSALVRDESPYFSPETRVFLRDCYDHCVQLLDLVDAWREMGSSLMDLHLSTIGQRTNEIMRLLTVISVLFMPMTFIAGLYGMNFDAHASSYNMPELSWRYGYPAALGMMATSALAFFLFFRRKGYLHPADRSLVDGTEPGPPRGGGVPL
jgi:magnesium transporter